ncbi:MAG: glycosyltransferase family 4 protein [Planctomycetota bacterium]
MIRPVNVLHARVVTGSGGGPDKTILRSAKYLDRGQYHVSAAYLYPANDLGIESLRRAAREQGMAFHAIPERGAIDRRAFGLLLDLCRRLHIDIWHSHDYKTDLLGLLIRRHHPMKLVTTVHGFTRETWRTKLYAKLNDLALLGYDQVLAVSPLLVRHCAERGVNPGRLVDLPNGIELDQAKRARSTARARAEYGIDTTGPHLVVVSRFSPEKGVDRAVTMIKRLIKTEPSARLHLVGDGPQRAALEAQAEQLGVSSCIQWWGWQTQVQPILEAMDTLLLTSHTEGLPNAVLEAMAVGVPVAATRVGAVPGVLAQGDAGVLLSQNEAEWPGQVAPLLRDTLEREQMLQRAREQLFERYDFKLRMQRVASIYDQVMGLKRTAAQGAAPLIAA